MDTLDPKLKEILLKLPGGFLACQEESIRKHEEIHKKLTDLNTKIDEAVYVNLANGDGNPMKVANILPTIYKDVKDLKVTTEFLRDFQKLHSIFKKYKLYWIFAISIFSLLGFGIKDVIIEILKGAVK